VFAISSNHEVQSLPALQAAATGLPIVAAAHGSLPEVCRDGENGILVRSESPKAFAAALRAALIPAVAAQMGVASLRLARDHDEHATFDAYERLYAEMAARQARRPRARATAV
jgi:D-inositol-3-phosphate glycosyltransferase